MENPENRPEAAKLIDSVLNQYLEDMKRPVIGFSLCMIIYHALKDAGYLVEGV